MTENAQHEGSPRPLYPQRLTWAVLLAQWIEFARSALALPASGEGRRLRESVPDLIMLQAVWFALRDLSQLEPAERALGLDRAEVLVEKHTAALLQRWRHQVLPPQIRDLIGDARAALDKAGEK